MGLGGTTGFILSDGKSFHVTYSKTCVCLPTRRAGGAASGGERGKSCQIGFVCAMS